VGLVGGDWKKRASHKSGAAACEVKLDSLWTSDRKTLHPTRTHQ